MSRKIVIVHDWLLGGGAELVVEQLHKIFPDAPIYTSLCTPEWRKRLDNKVVTGYLQHWPLSALRKYIPFLRGFWFSRLKLDAFDLVISSSGAEAKFIKTKSKHIAYIHAPTHYYWSRYDEYLKHPGFGAFDWVARIGLKIFVGPMRRWDYKAAQRPDYLIANSNHSKAAIKKYYGRDSTVIHPPVDIEKFAKFAKPRSERSGFVIAGRQTPYKRFDLAVGACTKLNLPLAIIGDGPENKKLKDIAGDTITFLGAIADHNEVARRIGSAQAFIFPGMDDFGIVAAEALSAGTPVIAYRGGGALDYIHPGQNGLFFENQTVDSLTKALEKFNPGEFSYQPADKFSIKDFQQKISEFIKKTT